jgi:hypothetical protein
MKDKLLNAIIAVSVALAVICTPIHLFLGLRFTHAPRAPDTATGQVIPFNIHGGDVFVTLGQSQLYNWAFGIGVAATFAAAISILWKKRKPRNAV